MRNKRYMRLKLQERRSRAISSRYSRAYNNAAHTILKLTAELGESRQLVRNLLDRDREREKDVREILRLNIESLLVQNTPSEGTEGP